jgi:hypothetical protein
MAGLTPDPFLDMDRVVKIDKIAQVMDPVPRQGLVIFVTFSNRRQGRGFGGNLGVTTHTGFGGRNTGKIVFFDGGVAIAAVKPQTAHMLLMAVRDRLRLRYANPGHGG